MASRKLSSAWGTFAVLVVVLLLLLTACLSSVPDVSQTTPEAPGPASTPASDWFALLQRSPYPYSIPLPPATPTILDGNYAKVEPQVGTHVPCKRCPDYVPEGGVWKLNLDKGVFRIWHEATGWRSIGSFTAFYDQTSRQRVDQLALFNDPYCPGVVGLYSWQREGGELVLQVVGDTCSMGVRAANLANRPWLSCQPPSAEADISDHWQKPPGCD
jgi:hypothetical protein